MKRLKTKYLDLELNSPIIVGSSALSKKIDNLKLAEASGAGAIVLKSLFEEEINYEINQIINENYVNFSTANNYIANYSKFNALQEYSDFIKRAKDAVSIPIIASINCTNNIEWEQFANTIEMAGADALELNLNIVNFDPNVSSSQIEDQYYKIIDNIKKATKLNIACKLAANYTNLSYFIKNINKIGIKSFVLFNKFFQPIIDIETEQIKSSHVFSDENEIKHTIRKIAIISSVLPNVEISASTGIHSANSIIQEILVGSTTVQLCSVLYKKGIREIKTIIEELVKWMDEKGYNTIDDFRNKLSYKNIKNPQLYERFQFIKAFTTID